MCYCKSMHNIQTFVEYLPSLYFAYLLFLQIRYKLQMGQKHRVTRQLPVPAGDEGRSLRWRHRSVMASPVTSNSTVYPAAVSAKNTSTIGIISPLCQGTRGTGGLFLQGDSDVESVSMLWRNHVRVQRLSVTVQWSRSGWTVWISYQRDNDYISHVD